MEKVDAHGPHASIPTKEGRETVCLQSLYTARIGALMWPLVYFNQQAVPGQCKPSVRDGGKSFFSFFRVQSCPWWILACFASNRNMWSMWRTCCACVPWETSAWSPQKRKETTLRLVTPALSDLCFIAEDFPHWTSYKLSRTKICCPIVMKFGRTAKPELLLFQYLLSVCNSIGTPVDTTTTEVEPLHLSMTESHVFAVSADHIFAWRFQTPRGRTVLELSGQRSKPTIEKWVATSKSVLSYDHGILSQWNFINTADIMPIFNLVCTVGQKYYIPRVSNIFCGLKCYAFSIVACIILLLILSGCKT